MGRHVPLRCCVATRELFCKESLLRIVRAQGIVHWDPSGKEPGRGAYLCPALACIDRAQKRRALERALRSNVPLSVYDDLRAEVERRGEGLHGAEGLPVTRTSATGSISCSG